MDLVGKYVGSREVSLWVHRHHGDVKAARFELECSTSGNLGDFLNRADLRNIVATYEEEDVFS